MPKFPCKKCPVLAMCKNKTMIHCSLLYGYMSGISGFKGIGKCLNKITNYFKKECVFIGHYGSINEHISTHKYYLKFTNSPMDSGNSLN